MKQQASVKQAQGINLTPQLLQSIRLLQLTAPQLELEIRGALERNPMLELDEDTEAGETSASGTVPASDAAHLDAAAMDEFPEPYPAAQPGLSAYDGLDDGVARLVARESADFRVRLLQTLSLRWELADLELASWWLDHTDDQGYLEQPLHELLVAGANANKVTIATMAEVRSRLLHGEWPGVAATNLPECLIAQLRALPQSPERDLAIVMLDRHADLISVGRLDEVAIQERVPLADAEQALALMRTLSLSAIEDDLVEPDYIQPDVLAWHDGHQWQVALANTTVPAVRINGLAEQVLTSSEHSNLKAMLEEARWLVRGIAMRNDTLLRTARALVRRQQAFLDVGDEALVPLTLSDIASEIEMHESTISRITVGKYIQTPRGPIELKHFFASRLEGSQLSGAAVRAMVKKMIDSEPAHAPLADATIASMLARNGIRVARRTVAKYREQLDIGSARDRARTFELTGTN